MSTHVCRVKTFWMTVLLVVCADAARGGQAVKRVCEVARPRTYPAGGPRSSDVIMRSLRLHVRNDKDPHDTMQALKDFHVTRLEWAYVTNKAFIEKVKASGRVFGGAASAPSYLHKRNDAKWFEKVVVLDLNGQPIIAPWKRTWNRTLWGCVNNPELERGYVEYLKGYINAGTQVMQRDEPGANESATHWGGCFCPHCMKAFREYLAKHTTATKRRELGIESIEAFDYAQHLRKQRAPVGDAFKKWDGGELKRLFVAFQTHATLEFHKRTRKAMDAHAGRRVPVSCNNGVHRWGPIQLCFDWAFGELSYGRTRPELIYQAMRAAAGHDRIQVITMPKKGDRKGLDQWQRRTRQTIATAYACGGFCMVPWDVYMPNNAPRYFGTPAQYADLFGFVRANAKVLEGYEDAAVAGKALNETRYGESPPVSLRNGTGEVRAFVRARPGQRDAPVVVHLVEWGKTSKPVTLALRTDAFFGDRPLAIKLLTPPTYDKSAHENADRTRNYAALSRTADLPSAAQGKFTVVQIPALDPWGILVVSP